MLNNLTPVVKNLLILNILMFLIKIVAGIKEIDLGSMLGLHSFGTTLFEPYQVVTHFFMHVDGFHILFNMFVLISFGPLLERIWGAKRFAIMYLVSALGAVLLYNGIAYFDIVTLKQSIGNDSILANIDDIIRNSTSRISGLNQVDYYLTKNVGDLDTYSNGLKYALKSYSSMMGASGAIMGLMAAFAILFPNTELQLLFPPVPIKAKYLIGGYFLIDLYLSFNNNGDNVAHLAHVGGAIAGGILVLIWRKKSNNFY